MALNRANRFLKSLIVTNKIFSHDSTTKTLSKYTNNKLFLKNKREYFNGNLEGLKNVNPNKYSKVIFWVFIISF
jgi:hypothetical protein